MDDGKIKQLDQEFEQEKQKTKHAADVLYKYRDLYTAALNENFPLEPEQDSRLQKLTDAQIMSRVQRLIMHLAYEFTSRLVDNLPRYRNPRIKFGFYDNQQWWEAKYRQIYIIHLRGDGEDARKLIESLRLQQKEMGGPKFAQKFADLLRK